MLTSRKWEWTPASDLARRDISDLNDQIPSTILGHNEILRRAEKRVHLQPCVDDIVDLRRRMLCVSAELKRLHACESISSPPWLALSMPKVMLKRLQALKALTNAKVGSGRDENPGPACEPAGVSDDRKLAAIDALHVREDVGLLELELAPVVQLVSCDEPLANQLADLGDRDLEDLGKDPSSDELVEPLHVHRLFPFLG